MEKSAKTPKSMEKWEINVVESGTQCHRQWGQKIPMRRNVQLWHCVLAVVWPERFWVVFFWGRNVWIVVISCRNVAGPNVNAPSSCLLNTETCIIWWKKTPSYLCFVTRRDGHALTENIRRFQTNPALPPPSQVENVCFFLLWKGEKKGKSLFNYLACIQFQPCN